MTTNSHLSELRKKHRVLSETIEFEQKQLSSDDLNIKRMKQQKLQLKQEIEKLSEAIA